MAGKYFFHFLGCQAYSIKTVLIYNINTIKVASPRIKIIPWTKMVIRVFLAKEPIIIDFQEAVPRFDIGLTG